MYHGSLQSFIASTQILKGVHSVCGPPSPAPESRSTTIPVLGNRSEIIVGTKVGETVAIERGVAEKEVDDGQSGLVNVLSRSAISAFVPTVAIHIACRIHLL